MKNLKGTKTHDNLKAAFAGESQANRRYLYFANKADVEGQNDVAALFRSTAEGETGHAHGHLDYLAQVGDPATDLPIGSQPREPEGRGRRRDARVHRHVPRHGEVGARRGLRRDRRLVRDAREGRAVAREPVPEGAGRAGRLIHAVHDRASCLARRSSRWSRSSVAGPDAQRLGAPPRRRRRPRPSFDSSYIRRIPTIMTVREGSLEAPTRHPLDWRNPEFYDHAALDKRTGAHLRNLPRLPPLREPVRIVPDALRPDRRGQDRRDRRRRQGRLHARSSTSATCATSAT